MLILLIGIGLTLAVTSARLHALDDVRSDQLTQAAHHAARAGDAVLGVPHVLVLLFLCAVCVSGLACWVVARHVMRPVLGVQQGLRSLARGELGVRMAPALAGRQDELGALAADFDATAQRLQELASAQETLLRDVSHELRSPLTRLRLALELARRDGPGMAAQLDRIERECGRLDALTGQVLQLARLREARAAVLAPLDLAALVGDTVADLAYEAEAAGKSVAWQPPRTPVRVHGAAAELASMLDNVLRNALRFTPRGERVDVLLALEGSQVAIAVRDRGPGIAPEHLDQVFAPFFQADPARSGGHNGAGLGLAIAQRVVRRHAGEIRLANRAGGGLQVEITLPAEPACHAGVMGPRTIRHRPRCRT